MDSSIFRKLRYSSQLKAAIVNAPDNFFYEFKSLAGPAHLSEDQTKGVNWALVFVYNKTDVDRLGPDIINASDETSIIWFAYPKKSSGFNSDITRDKGWDAVHNLGWAGVSMISIDGIWSAFRVKPQKESLVSNPTTDASVKAATGKNWKDWQIDLNGLGAQEMTHKEIVTMLVEGYKLDAWWSQMVTNAYEQFIGRRKKHEMQDGFQASVSKTLPFSISKTYQAFADPLNRESWLQDPGIQVSTTRENKSLRALWVDGKTRISVDFYSKGEQKCQVVVQHLKLPTSEDCEGKKTYWKKNLQSLLEVLQG